jgi:thiamine biosynthesis protein ThiI
MMLRYAEAIAKRGYFDFIIMGDSLGQVASQTLANIAVIDNVVTIPILRPLIGFDKEEIIDIAKHIGTYDLSIKKSAGCLAVPKKPATQAKIQQIISIENQLLIKDLVDYAIRNIQYI